LGAFGEKLRRQREQRGIALEAISSSTKISTRMLRAIEEENFEQLPGGVFNKGFVRAFARQIGLNEEEAVSDYLAALRESQIQSQQILPSLRGGKSSGPAEAHPAGRPQQVVDGRHPAKPTIVEAVRSESTKEIHPVHAEARERVPSAGAESSKSNTKEKTSRKQARLDEGRRNEKRRNDERRAQERRVNDDRRGELKSDQRFTEAAPLLEGRRASDLLSEAPRDGGDADRRSRPTPLFSSGTFGESESNGVPWGKLAAVLIAIFVVAAFWNLHRRQARVESHSSALAAAPQPAAMSLPVQSATSQNLQKTLGSGRAVAGQASMPPTPIAANGASRMPRETSAASNPIVQPLKSVARATVAKAPATFTLRIRALETIWISVMADGRSVAQETLIAPAETSIRANSEIVVKTGNAAGIGFALNAKEIPAEGKEGEVRTFTFDSSGMKASAAQSTNLTNVN
jgi:cytoskeletal protein RodZ